MALTEDQKKRFEMLCIQSALGGVTLLEVTERATEKKRTIVCIVEPCGDGNTALLPIARMFDDDEDVDKLYITPEGRVDPEDTDEKEKEDGKG